MEQGNKHSGLEGIKKEQLKRRTFTLDFKAEVVRHKKAENLSYAACGEKFDVLPKVAFSIPWNPAIRRRQLSHRSG
jgi:hypothetical protein